MIKRIVEVSHASRIYLRDQQLAIEQRGELGASIPVEDIVMLILAHPANIVTQQALMACQGAGAAVVICGANYMPQSLMLPLDGSSLHAEVLRLQVAASDTVKGAMWRQIVSRKIEAQASLLTPAEN